MPPCGRDRWRPASAGASRSSPAPSGRRCAEPRRCAPPAATDPARPGRVRRGRGEARRNPQHVAMALPHSNSVFIKAPPAETAEAVHPGSCRSRRRAAVDPVRRRLPRARWQRCLAAGPMGCIRIVSERRSYSPFPDRPGQKARLSNLVSVISGWLINATPKRKTPRCSIKVGAVTRARNPSDGPRRRVALRSISFHFDSRNDFLSENRPAGGVATSIGHAPPEIESAPCHQGIGRD